MRRSRLEGIQKIARNRTSRAILVRLTRELWGEFKP